MSEELDIMEDMGAYCPFCNALLDAQQYFGCECYCCGAVWDDDTEGEDLVCEGCGSDIFTEEKDILRCSNCNKEVYNGS